MRAKKGNCPTCNKSGVPDGMHCRHCICDILSGSPIGTSREIDLEKRRQKKREKRLPFRSIVEIYN